MADTFLGPVHGPLVKKAVGTVNKLDNAAWKDVLQQVVAYSLDEESLTEELAVKTKVALGIADANKSDHVLAAVYAIVRTAVRQRVDDKVLNTELGEIKLTPERVGDITKIIAAQRAKIEAAAISNVFSFPNLEDLRWRVDVTISDTSMSRVLRPSLMMQMRLTDGSVHEFECSIEKFHDLRYNVAKLLKEMQELQKKRLLREAGKKKRR